MNFNEILDEVYALTSRPDLVALTKSAVKAATLKAHYTDFYSKDIYEAPITFATASYTQSFDYSANISNYRALKYMRHWDSVAEEAGEFITMILPEQVIDVYQRERTNICYVAGRIIEIKASIEFTHILFGCYVSPIVTEVGYSSWVATLYPWAIVHEAARVVFATIGMSTESNAQRQLVAEQYSELKMNALADVGY